MKIMLIGWLAGQHATSAKREKHVTSAMCGKTRNQHKGRENM